MNKYIKYIKMPLMTEVLLTYNILPVRFIYPFFKIIFKGGFRKNCMMIAVSIDQLNNIVCKELLNDISINKKRYKFGKVDKTISSALGRNILTYALSTIGKLLNLILHTISDSHCVKHVEWGLKVDALVPKHNTKIMVQTTHMQAQLTSSYKRI